MTMMSDDFPMIMEREAGMPETVPQVSVAFGLYPQKDNKASAEAGRDIFKDVEFVKIAIPGDRNSLFFQPADATHRARFPQAYAAFSKREQSPKQGTPIEQWAPISRSLAMTLRAMHIDTVEALSNVHDGFVDKIGGNGRELRAKALAWLQEAKEGAAATKLAADNQALQDQIASLQAQISALQNQTKGSVSPAPQGAAVMADPTDDIERDVAAAARRTRKSVA